MDWMDNDYWTTKDGQHIYPKDMSDVHLKNTIQFLEDRAAIIQSVYYKDFVGGQCEEQVFKMSAGMWLSRNCRIYNLLKSEARVRNFLRG